MATTKKNSKSLQVLSKDSLTQQDIPSLLNIVNEKIKALKGDTSEDTRTDGKLPGIGNINDIDDPVELITAYASVEIREEGFDKAQESMKITEKRKFKLGNYTGEAFKNDILKRYHEVTYKEQLEKLTSVKSELEKHLSKDDKLKAALGNIKDILVG